MCVLQDEQTEVNEGKQAEVIRVLLQNAQNHKNTFTPKLEFTQLSPRSHR